MSLAEALEATPKPRLLPNRCPIPQILSELPEDEVRALNQMLDETWRTSTWVAEMVHQHCGFQINDRAVRAHRRRGRPGGCKCPLPKR